MNRIARYAVLAALAVAGSLCGFSPALAETCQLAKIASFDISQDSEGVVTIPVAVNGTSEKFLVDTGGAYSMISRQVAEALHLKPRHIRSAELYMADGTFLNQLVIVDTLGIGVTRATNVALVLEPLKSRTGAETFAGILAPDYLPNFDLDFDFAHNKLNFFSPDHCEGRAVYWSLAYAAVPFSRSAWDNQITVPVTLDGHDFTAIVDTGASDTLLSAKAARNFYDLTLGAPGMEPVPGAGGDALVPFRHRFKSLTLNGIAVNNPMIGILRDEAEKSFWNHHNGKEDRDPIYGLRFQPERVTIGMNVLRKLHLYIAYKEKTLYVTAADAVLPVPATASAAAK